MINWHHIVSSDMSLRSAFDRTQMSSGIMQNVIGRHDVTLCHQPIVSKLYAICLLCAVAVVKASNNYCKCQLVPPVYADMSYTAVPIHGARCRSVLSTLSSLSDREQQRHDQRTDKVAVKTVEHEYHQQCVSYTTFPIMRIVT